jgi:glyoxylase-like metal-dependent hydrolase (beta-lactamase superfamily II)
MSESSNELITVLEYPGGISAIDSGMVREQMAACYLLETGSSVAVIETGNAASADRIMKVLQFRGRQPEEVSHVIVTHVHLDHAGGAGRLLQKLPQAEFVVHPRGARHMIDPSRLEASARQVYGDRKFEAMYGALLPVPEERVRIMDDGDRLSVGHRELLFMDAPGHARHHFTIWDEASRGWFTGDTFGLSYRELDTDKGAFIFPTTTPIQFDPPALAASVDRMMAREPENMYLTHFGRVRDIPRLAEDLHEGIRFFAETGEKYADAEERTRRIEDAMRDWLTDRLRAHGVTLDDERLAEIVGPDIVLNTQGIEFWLDHGRHRDG